MNRPLFVIYLAIMLDAVGIGLIFPILPALLRDVTGADSVALYIGAMTAIYAVMQFLFASVIGALSDRLGRRPILLVSLAGATVNYLFLAVAPNLWLQFAGRAIAGLTSANISVATAYITDISTEDLRARRFGMLNAMFGTGFILGPILGGALGDQWLRLPFIAAALLNAANFLLAQFVLPESRVSGLGKTDLSALNPLRPLRWVLTMKSLLPFVVIFFLFSATGEAYGICWALWGKDAFHWNGLLIGLSLGCFGVCQTVAQMLLPGPAVKLLGERAAILTGVAAVCTALAVMAFATEGWMIFAVMPVFALGSIGVPALQSLVTRQVDRDLQGQLQGVLASVVSFASIIAPIVFSSLYFVVREVWPGALWLSVVIVYGLTVPVVLGLRTESLRDGETGN